MRIIFFSDYFIPEIGAPAAHVYDRCRIWVEQGHEVTVITNTPNYPNGKPYNGYKNKFRYWEDIDGIKVLRVMTYMAENKGTIKRTLDYFSYFISSFLNSFFLKKPDVVLSTSPHIFTPLGAILFSFLRRVPHVVEIRDLWPESIAATTGIKKTSLIYKAFELIEFFIYRNSKNIILFTKAFKTSLQEKGINPDKMHVVINGANLKLFSEQKYDQSLARSLGLINKFIISYFGTHGLAHNLLNAINAAKLVQDDDIHLLFIGDGAEKQKMIKAVKEDNISNVHFIDKKPRDELSKYWSISNAGLVHLKKDPAFKKVIPSKIFETMAIGIPIVYAGPKSEGSEIIKQTNSGLVSEANSPHDLAKNFKILKENTSLYREFKTNSKNSSKNFSRESQAAGTMNVLEKSLKSK